MVVRRKAALQANAIRFPLMVQTRLVHRLLHIHFPVDDVENDLQDAVDDARSAGAPTTM